MFNKDNGADEAKKHGAARSPKWDTARKAHLQKEPKCVACGTKKKKLLHVIAAIFKPPQVHHEIPFHVVVALGRPDLELDDRNLITLCESGDDHHLLLGHLGFFGSSNPSIREHAEKTFHGKARPEITSSDTWKKLVISRPRALDDMTEADKKELQEYINKKFPKPF